MLTRLLRVTMVLLVLVAGVAVVRMDSLEAPARLRPVAQSAKAKATLRCDGLERRDVRGLEPAYSQQGLSEFRNHRTMCRGIWLPKPRRKLVPQGIAITGRTAWLSGFRYRPGYGRRPCQLMQVDLLTGRRLAFHSSIQGRVGRRPLTYCRHGGGILQRGRWLWLVESSKLWLVDLNQRTDVLRARRAWRIEAPVRGSSIVASGDRLGLVPFQKKGVPHIYWFSFRKLLGPGVLDLAVRRDGKHQLGAVTSTRVPRLVQGATLDAAGRLYLSRSNLYCGELVAPDGRRLAFIPGAEGLAFSADGKRLWAVSESGARPYASPRRPFTPAVASFEWLRLFDGKRASCFKPG